MENRKREIREDDDEAHQPSKRRSMRNTQNLSFGDILTDFGKRFYALFFACPTPPLHLLFGNKNKLTQKWVDPNIYVLHNFLTDSVIEQLKALEKHNEQAFTNSFVDGDSDSDNPIVDEYHRSSTFFAFKKVSLSSVTNETM